MRRNYDKAEVEPYLIELGFARARKHHCDWQKGGLGVLIFGDKIQFNGTAASDLINRGRESNFYRLLEEMVGKFMPQQIVNDVNHPLFPELILE